MTGAALPITPEQCCRACILLAWHWPDLVFEDDVIGAVATAANTLESGEATDIGFLADSTVRHHEPAS